MNPVDPKPPRPEWPVRVLHPVLLERETIADGRVVTVEVYRDDRGFLFCECTLSGTGDGRFLPQEEFLVRRGVTRSAAVHMASEIARKWFQRMRQQGGAKT